MPNHHALIIDDEPDIRELLEMTLSRMDLQVTTAQDVTTAKQALRENRFDLCFTDMRLPDGDGIDLVKHISEEYPDLPVAMITAYGNTGAAVAALKAGAFDFVSKPVDLRILRGLVGDALKLASTGGKGPSEGAQSGSDLAADRLRGTSPAISSTRKTIAKLSRSQAPVYISGESGVGKELAARLIHDLGPRAKAPFVPVNCGAIPSELMESEFFGHIKGSFTGAVVNKCGLFESANGGTLFLDEVADLPIHMQVKLLRTIQEKSIRPIGSSQERPVNVRILSATHKDLSALVEQSQFRQDLFYRINVIELQMPSLRERQEDIDLLANFFIERIATGWNVERPRLTSSALSRLQQYAFPGNVRELENILERAITLCDRNEIDVEDLHLPATRLEESYGETVDSSSMPLEEYMGNIEREAILRALEETRFNKTAAARKLGITFRSMRYKLKKLGIE